MANSLADLKTFVTTYQGCNSTREVAEKLDWNNPSGKPDTMRVNSLKQQLKQKGIPLKTMGRARLTESDLGELTALCNGEETKKKK